MAILQIPFAGKKMGEKEKKNAEENIPAASFSFFLFLFFFFESCQGEKETVA